MQVRGESMSSLARRLNLKSKQSLWGWLDETHAPRDPDAFKRIADALGVSLDDLLNPDVDVLKVEKVSEGPLFRGEALASLLLDVIEDPETTPENREVARYTILLMLKERNLHVG